MQASTRLKGCGIVATLAGVTPTQETLDNLAQRAMNNLTQGVGSLGFTVDFTGKEPCVLDTDGKIVEIHYRRRLRLTPEELEREHGNGNGRRNGIAQSLRRITHGAGRNGPQS